MSNETQTGSCFCGEVEYEISGNIGIFQYCHCSRCRKVTGSAHASNLFVKPDQFRWIKGEALVVRFEPEDTKYFATCFCKNCGSNLPWASKGGKTVIVPAGSLNQHPGIEPIQNIFFASKAEWYKHASELPEYDEFPKK